MPSIKLRRSDIDNIEMTLENTEPLGTDAIPIFEKVTASHIRDYHLEDNILESVEEVDVLYLGDVQLGRRKTFLRTFSRSLDGSALKITFATTIKYRPTLQSYDMNRAVSDAFRTNLSKFKYADSLKTASPSLFQSTRLETVDVPQNEEDTDDGDILINVNDINESSNDESGGDDSIMGTLIGGSIGVVVFAACTAIYVIRRKKLIKDDKALLAAEDEDLFAEVKDTNDLYKVKEEKSAAPVEDAVVTR